MDRARKPGQSAPGAAPPRVWSLSALSLLAATDGGRSWLDRLLGLSRVSWADEQVVLGWRFDLPAWAWAAVVLGAVALAVWSYSRMLGPRPVRMLLAGMRALLLVLIAALLAGPTLVRPEEQIERDWLLVLVDRSASMQVADTLDETTGEPLTREQALRRAIEQQRAVFGEAGLSHERRVAWLGFDAQTYPIAEPGETNNWPAPEAQATALRTALDQALQAAAGRPISGIVLFTDGRSPEATGADVVRRLQQQAVGVFAVPLGAKEMPLDLALGQVDAPEQAFANDVVPVSVTVDRFGGAAALDPARVTLRLVDEATERVLDERTLEGAAPNEAVRLSARSEQVGQVRWRVEVEHAPGPGEPRELIVHNNRRPITIELIDRPLNVLYVEGYPRWEYRYLKNMLVREGSIASSILLLSADRGFAQEGDVPITRLPQTAEEMSRYDVVILGDVPPEAFTPDQIALLRDHVAGRGAGLLWIGGPRHTPRGYDGTPLADLLPMQSPGAVDRYTGGEVALIPTPLARSLSVLDLRAASGGAEDAAASWPDELPPLLWVQAMGPLKAAADVIATAATEDAEPTAADPMPLIARLRYGAGQALYVATDDTWRWRYGRGERYFEPFWIQLVRMLGRERVQQAGQQARLSVSHRRVEVGEAVVVELIVEDPALLERQLARIAVAVRRAGARAAPVDQLELHPVTTNGPTPGRAGEAQRTYRAVWRPTDAGELAVRVTEPALDALNLRQPITVIAADDELRRPQPDHARLAALAKQTGGAVVGLGELDRLVDLVPNRDRRTPTDVREPLWHSPLALILVLVLLTSEWVVRKVVRLV